jgi:transposase
MTKINFTPEDLQAIQHERFHHPHPRVRQKMEVLWLKSKGVPHAQITELAQVCPNTMLTYFKEFQKGGIESIRKPKFNRPISDLTPYTEQIKEALAKKPPINTQEAQEIIEMTTGIRRSPTQIRKFLHKIGIKPRKVGSIPAKADVQKQADFKKNSRTTSWRS